MAVAALLLIAATLCLYGLGGNGLHELDEGRHVQSALEMHRSGDLWRPTAFGRPFFSKPALPLWLMVAAYHVFGTTDFASRIWSALFAVAAVLTTYLLGEHVAGVATGFVAGLVLATSYPFLYTHCARSGEFDSLMVFCFTGATVLFLRAVRTGRGWILCAAAAAMSSHAKNFAGVVPATVFLLSLCFVPPERRPTGRQWLGCGLVFVGLNLVWLLPMVAIHGRPFWEQYVETELLRRPFKAGSHTSTGTALMYWTTLVAGFSPWTVPSIGGLVEDARKAIARRDLASIVVLAWVLVLGAVLCFGLRRGNQWYLIPMFPFLALSAARLLVGSDERPPLANAWRIMVCLAAIGGAAWELRPLAAPFALWSITRPRLVPSPPARLGWLALASIAALAAAAWSYRDENRHRRPWILVSWPAITVLSIAALQAVARPLPLADHRNVYERARDAILASRAARCTSSSHPPGREDGNCSGQLGTVVVMKQGGRYDMLTRYYFSNLEGIDPRFVRQAPRPALIRNAQLRGPVWQVLIAKPGGLIAADSGGGRLLFRGSELSTHGDLQIDVAVLELDPVQAE